MRNTRDVDILLRREDLALATAALENAGFVHRRIASLGKTGTLDVFLDGPEAKPRDAVHVVFANERIHPDNALPSADVEGSEATDEFRLVGLEALVRMKLVANQDKDCVHLRDLSDVGLLDEALIAKLPQELQDRLRAVLEAE